MPCGIRQRGIGLCYRPPCMCDIGVEMAENTCIKRTHGGRYAKQPRLCLWHTAGKPYGKKRGTSLDEKYLRSMEQQCEKWPDKTLNDLAAAACRSAAVAFQACSVTKHREVATFRAWIAFIAFEASNTTIIVLFATA